MAATTDTTTTRTCPPSAVVDMIIPWREVTAADLVVLDGVLTTPERVHIYEDIWNRETGETFIRVDVSHLLDNGHLVTCEQRGDSLTAVRRYTEGSGQCATEADAPLSETERWQVEEARNTLARWDRKHGPEIYGTDRTLADTVCGLLAIVDQLAPAGEES